MRRLTTITVVAACLAGLVGCTAPAAQDPGPGPSPTPSATTTPTPTPTPTPVPAGPSDLSDPELGITFTDFPHDQDESTAAAIETYMLFETEFWRALTTNVVPPGPWAVASNEAIAWIQAQVGPNTEAGTIVSGKLSTTVAVVSGDATSMVLAACRDLHEMTFIHADGSTVSAAEPGAETTGARFGLVMTATTGWRIDTYEPTGTC